jgi:hypothetical protein
MVADVGVADVTVEVVAGEVVMLSRRKRGGLVRGGGARPVESEWKEGLLTVVVIVGDEIDALVVVGDSV